MPTDREQTRERIVAAAADLLRSDGRDAVTTRAVAAAAGVQAPVIYRIFGDKDGLLDAVARHCYAAFVAHKREEALDPDPVADLARGWDLAVAFGVEHPALHALMHGDPTRVPDPDVHAEGLRLLREKVDRVAGAGRLRLAPTLATAVVRATALGAVETWNATPVAERDAALLAVMRDAMVVAVTTDEPVVVDRGAAGAARALRARLGEQEVLTDAEAGLLGDWLDRIEAG